MSILGVVKGDTRSLDYISNKDEIEGPYPHIVSIPFFAYYNPGNI